MNGTRKRKDGNVSRQLGSPAPFPPSFDWNARQKDDFLDDESDLSYSMKILFLTYSHAFTQIAAAFQSMIASLAKALRVCISMI